MCVQATIAGHDVLLRPLLDDEIAPLARDLADDPEVNPWWGSSAETIERWLRDPGSVVFGIVSGGELAGVIQYEEQDDPDYRFAGIDIAVLSSWLGRGLGTDSLHALARHLIEERGHHRLHIDPAAANTRAIAAYRKVGFKPVGIMRRYERGPDGTWRDALLMDLLAEELVDPRG